MAEETVAIVPEVVALYDQIIDSGKTRLDFWTDQFHHATSFADNEDRLAAREQMSWWNQHVKSVRDERDHYLNTGETGVHLS